MQVTIIPPAGGGSPVQLADGSGQKQWLDDGHSWDFFGGKQIGKFLRASSQRSYYRSNEGVRLTFTVVREFTSIGDCEAFQTSHRKTTPKFGTLELRSTNSQSNQGTDNVANIPNCTIENIHIKPMGRACYVTYTCEGGAMQ